MSLLPTARVVSLLPSARVVSLLPSARVMSLLPSARVMSLLPSAKVMSLLHMVRKLSQARIAAAVLETPLLRLHQEETEVQHCGRLGSSEVSKKTMSMPYRRSWRYTADVTAFSAAHVCHS